MEKETNTDDQYREPEERVSESSELIDHVFDPMEDDVKDRAHTTSGLGTGGTQPMPEYKVNADMGSAPADTPLQPGLNGEMPEADMPGYDEYKKQHQEETKNMSPQEQKDNAMMTAEFLVDSYAEGWKWMGNQTMPFGKKTIERLKKEGLDLSTPIQFGDTQKTIAQIIHEWNEESTDKLGMDQKTKDKIIPLLAAELQKRGAIMSPLMYMFVLIGVHAGKQIKIIVASNKKKDTAIDAMVASANAYNAYVSAGGNNQPPPAPVQQTSATVSNDEITDVEDISPLYTAASDIRQGSAFNKIQAERRAGYDRARGNKKTTKKGTKKGGAKKSTAAKKVKTAKEYLAQAEKE